jgi:ABC-type glycerol-3-phosphate transport system permease component
MADLLNLIMLVCAAVGSMAFGVLTAYAIFRMGFALMRPRRQQAAVKVRAELAPE